MLLNKYLIVLDYGLSTVYIYRFAIPKKNLVNDLKEWLSTHYPDAKGFNIVKVTSKKVDLSVVDFLDETRVKKLKLQYVKYQIEKGIIQ